jgi:adenylate cyclase
MTGAPEPGATPSGERSGAPPLSAAAEDAFWRDVLGAQGATSEEIDRAAREGPLELYALERYILDDVPEYDIVHAAATSGLDIEEVRAFWRALGFPDPQPGEATFSPSDLEVLATVIAFIDAQVLDKTVALQMARVIGSSLARIATAQVEAADLAGGGISGTPRSDLTAEQQAIEVERSARLIPMLSGVMQLVWRRHLASAARARIMRGDDERERPVTVGFADLEGFTSLSQQLPEHELAEVVNRFEQIAYDTVARFTGARVVKMIGDEVMFAADDVRTGAELALTLAEAYGADDALGDVRVGLATGSALKLEGDLYGPAVNLASRIVSIAYPGSVVVPAEVVDGLAGDPAYSFLGLRSHHLRHIGRVKLWVLRREEEPPEGEDLEGRTLRRARERRAARRVWIADRMAEQLAGLAAETAGDVTDRAVRRIVEGKPARRDDDESGP